MRTGWVCAWWVALSVAAWGQSADRALERKLRRALVRLGPSAAERLEELEPDAEERAEMREQIEAFHYVQRQGSAVQERRQRRQAFRSEWGIEGTTALVDALSWERYWSARGAAVVLGDMLQGGSGEDVRWVMLHLDAPGALIAMFGRGPWNEHVGLEQVLNQTLSRLSGESLEGPAAWQQWWASYRSAWNAEQQADERLRERVEAALEAVEAGEEPDLTGLDELLGQQPS